MSQIESMVNVKMTVHAIKTGSATYFYMAVSNFKLKCSSTGCRRKK